MYPKIAGIIGNMRNYEALIKPLLEAPIRKSAKVFDDKKVTDHHAIIPTGVHAQGLVGNEALVYDTIAKRFLAAFYPDCEVMNTVVLGAVKEIEFKANGKQILDPGWRLVYNKEAVDEDEKEETQILPAFEKGESGAHDVFLAEGKTSAPKPFTEATLLRAMETAGKQVDDEELRDVMKDNGIGRPSTRAAIIETLFRRNYIKRERKNVVPTITGMELIRVINNELLKSAEMTGKWEYKLRQIEKGDYQAEAFLHEMKSMVSELVIQVKSESAQRIQIASHVPDLKKEEVLECPKCRKGTMLKGKTAMGCSEFKNGCTFKVPFDFKGKKLSESQLTGLIKKKKTSTIKGFNTASGKKDGVLELNEQFDIVFNEVVQQEKSKKEDRSGLCPKCNTAAIIKGGSAYGCAAWKSGCDFRLPFEFMGKTITEAHIQGLLKKGETAVIKGLSKGNIKINAKLKLDETFQLTAIE
jgi:DNA topoisomerase-3